MLVPHVLRLGSHRYAIVWTDEDRYQTTTPLAADHAPAHTACMRGTDDVCIRRMAHHAGGARYRTLAELADAHDLTPGQLAGARKRGMHVQRAGRVVS